MNDHTENAEPKNEKPTRSIINHMFSIITKPLLWLFSDLAEPMSAKDWIYGILFMIALSLLTGLFAI